MNTIGKAGLVVGAAAILAAAATAQKKNKEQVPEAAIQAKYVYVEAYDGPQWDPQVSAADRRAIIDVEQAVRSWGRYQLVLRRSEAEMVLQVRKGRIVEGRTGGGISVDQVPTHIGFPPANKTQTTTNADVGAEAGPADDLLFVYLVGADGQLGTRLWHSLQKDGLDAPDFKLFQKFEDDVNAAVAARPKKKPADSADPSRGGAPAPAPDPSSAPSANPKPPNYR